MTFALPTRPDLIIFDMDGVLHDSERFGWQVIRSVLAEFGVAPSQDELEADYGGLSWPDFQKKAEADLGISLGSDFVEETQERWLDLLNEEMEAAPGIATFLKLLEDEAIPFCLASNSFREEIDESLEISGLEIYFPEDYRFSGMDMARAKPAPDLHLACLDMFKVAPHQALVIEDSITGASGAINATVPLAGYVGLHPHPAVQKQALLDLGAATVFDDWADAPEALLGL